MKRVALSLAVLALTTMGATAVSQAALSAANDAHVGFQASGPAGLKIEGSTSELSVADDGTNVVITVPLANLNTGISLRDHHMREKYLEVPKFPTALLSVARSAIKVPPAGKAEGDAPGSLTMHGQTHPVTVHYEATAEGSTLSAKGQFHVNMNDYGITVPSYLGVTVKPDVTVDAKFKVSGN